MQDSLLGYYERELAFFRQLGQEFAQAYPKIAGRLLLEAGEVEDPHVERLIQGNAFLAARIRQKIDDEFPEITNSLLSHLYPHFLAPIPSMAIVQFVPDPDQGKLTTGHCIERGTPLYSPAISGLQCRFRTCYPVTLLPIEVKSAGLEAPDNPPPGLNVLSMIRLRLECLGGTKFEELGFKQLRFFLHGESQTVYPLYELLFNNVCETRLRPVAAGAATRAISLSPKCLRPVGFELTEGMLPYGSNSLLGYRLLQEYFVFPEKFLFVDLCDVDPVALKGCGDKIDLLIFLDRAPRLEHSINAGTFRMGCTPVVNLFHQIAEPIRVDHMQTEYRVIPDIRHENMMEVYSIDSVAGSSPDKEDVTNIQPFYSFKHAYGETRHESFWFAGRRQSERKGDQGTEVHLSLVDLNFRPTMPASDTLTVHTTCTNRDLPAKLPFGSEQADFELEKVAPLAHIRCLTKPTQVLRPPLRGGTQWRLISHLSLNYLSICEEGREALQEILKLYDFSDSPVIRQQISGITNVTTRRVVGRLPSNPWQGFCRGLEVTIEFAEDKYVGSGAFLFGSVLERFLGLYVSVNTFIRMIAMTQNRQEPIKKWPARAGDQILL